MDLAQKIFNNALLLKKQFEIAKQNPQTPQDVRGSIETIEVGIVEILRDADKLVEECNSIEGYHEREIKRLKDKIAKLENKPKTP